MTGCECTSPGFCERHQCHKSRHWWRLCRSDRAVFLEWENGAGPGQIQSTGSGQERLIAPLRDVPVSRKPWEGACRKKPWDYRVAAVIPVLDTPEPLELVIGLLRLQSERPYIIVIDTGSRPAELAKVEALRAPDLEVHSLRLNGVQHPSDFPAMAMDLAFAICRSPYLFATHADCFLRSRTLLEEMVALCPSASPVVGYEISPRQHPDWKGMVGHTCTLFDMATMDQIGAGWSMRRLVRIFDIETHEPNPERPNWPDTELLVNYLVRQAGYEPHLIGHEDNFVRNRDDNIDHCRTLTGGLLYNRAHYEKAMGWMDEAMREARERMLQWRQP